MKEFLFINTFQGIGKLYLAPRVTLINSVYLRSAGCRSGEVVIFFHKTFMAVKEQNDFHSSHAADMTVTTTKTN